MDNDYGFNDILIPDLPEPTAPIILPLKRKEVENYLIEARIVYEAAAAAAERRRNYGQTNHIQSPSISEVEDALSHILDDPMVRNKVKYQVVHRYRDVLPNNLDQATKDMKADQWFDAKWSDKQWRIENCPGKEVLRRLRSWCQDTYSLSLSATNLADQFDECPIEIISVAQRIESHFYG